MDIEELKFESRKNKIESFKKDLIEIRDKYSFEKHESDQYDGEENYCGTDYHFVVEDEPWYHETILDIITDVFGVI